MKKVLSVLFAIATSLCMLFAVACSDAGDSSGAGNKPKKLSIKLEKEFADGTQIPYAKEITFPSATVTDEKGDVVSYEIVYKVADKAGETTESSYPNFELAPGAYTLTYFYSEELKLTYSFTVVDSDKPEISFSKVPADLFIGENEYSTLPAVKIEDASEVEAPVKKLTFRKSGEETETEVEYNKMNDSFPVGNEQGTFTLTVTAADIWGNETTESVSWQVKNYDWAAPTPESGYVADFADEGYLNYVRSGEMSPYWNIKGDHKDEWLRNFEGADGVVKIDIGFTPENYNVISVKLPKPVKKADIEGRYLAVRAYVSGESLDNFFGFGGIWYMDGQDSAASVRQTGLKIGEWGVYYISYEDLVNAKCYSVETDKNSDITKLQFCFRRTDALMSYMSLYLDRITIAEKLPSVGNLTVENGKATWNAVDNAGSYIVTEGGEITSVEGTEYTLRKAKGVVTVAAKGDNVSYLDSESASVAYGITPKAGEFASFDDELYSSLVTDKVNVGGETKGYAPGKVVNSYTDGVFNTTFGCGSWGIVSSLAIKFPVAADLTGMDYLVIKMSVSCDTELSKFAVYDLDYTKYLGKIEMQSGLYTYIIDISDKELTKINGIEFLIQSKEGTVGDVNVTFGYIAGAKNLGEVKVANDKANHKITWEAVENAAGYVVKIDNNEETVLPADTLGYVYPSEGYGTITIFAKGDGKNFFDGKKADIRYDSREILENVGGFLLNGKTLSWTKNEKAAGYKVKINEKETETDKEEYVITERGYIVVEVKALGNGTTTADGEYVVACGGDFFLDGRYLADFTAGYEKLVDNDVNSMLIGDYFIEKYSAKFVEDGNYTEITLNELKWNAYGAIRVKLPNAAAASGKYIVKYKVTGINGEKLSASQFRIIEREGGWVYTQGATSFDGDWAYAEVTLDENASGGLVFVFDGASVNGIKLGLDYIVKVEKLAAPENITVENSSKTLSWNAVSNATAYEIVKDGEVWKTVNETTVSCEGIGTFGVLGVRAVGGIGFKTSEITAANITLSGDDWVEIAGTLKIVGHAQWEPGLIQLEFDKAGMNASEAVDFGKLVIEANGEKIAATKFEYGNEVKFNVYANYPETYAGGVSTVVFRAGSVLIQNSKLYKIENDYTVVYNGSNWIALVGEIDAEYVGWSSNTQIQINNLDLSYLEQGTVKFFGSISSCGADITPVLTYHASPKTLDITETYNLTSSEEYPLPQVTIKKGTIIWQTNKAYRFAKDWTVVYREDGNNDNKPWAYLSDADFSWSSAWGNIVQLKSDMLFASSAINGAGLIVYGNGVKLTGVIANANTDELHHIQFKTDVFPKEASNGYAVPTVVIKAGSVIAQNNSVVAARITKDVTLAYVGGRWAMAGGNVSATRVSWDGKDQNPPLVQIQFDVTFLNYAIDLSGAEILFNGNKTTEISAVANPDDLHHVQFKSNSFPQNDGDTIVIKKGSVLKQDKIEFVVTEDIVLTKVDSVWTLG